MELTDGKIEGVVVSQLKKFTDERGWLAELFRKDELALEFHPAMCYVSWTQPGVVRGPHEHVDQADLFAWFGPGRFKISLWDNRPDSSSFGNRMEFVMGDDCPGTALIPRGVVHCYRCISEERGLVINCPNRLFAGEGKHEPIDEIRHEDDAENPFVKDELARRRLAQ